MARYAGDPEFMQLITKVQAKMGGMSINTLQCVSQSVMQCEMQCAAIWYSNLQCVALCKYVTGHTPRNRNKHARMHASMKKHAQLNVYARTPLNIQTHVHTQTFACMHTYIHSVIRTLPHGPINASRLHIHVLVRVFSYWHACVRDYCDCVVGVQ